jgi:phage/plasmid-associated DNA primase
MRLDADDRRYFCLEISDKKKNDDTYFAPQVNGLTNEATQQAFFNYLANYDVSDFHHQRPPMSAMKRDMIGASADNVIVFVKDVCENEVVGLEYEKDTAEITPTCADVFELYIAWCKNNDEKDSSASSVRRSLEISLGGRKSSDESPRQTERNGHEQQGDAGACHRAEEAVRRSQEGGV